MEKVKFELEPEQEGVRLDKCIAGLKADISRSYIQKLIAQGSVTVNGVPAKAKTIPKAGDCIELSLPEPSMLTVLPEPIPLDILYEDDDIIIINKPKGMVVHPAAGHYTGTLVNGLLYHCKGSLSGINGILRPGIVHRIDKDTTGVLAVCKNDRAHQCLAEQLRVHSITRKYHAIVYRTFKDASGTIDAPIGRHPVERVKMAVNYHNGRAAVTHYTCLKNFASSYAYIECKLETGRTHQIRVHMAHIGHPLVGDTVYGPQKDPFRLQGQALHAKVLGFLHPVTGAYMEFEAPLPDYFTALLGRLSGRPGGAL